ALLPPVSGGAGARAGAHPPRSAQARCTLSERPLDPEEVAARVVGPDAGGVVSFVGAVRNASRGRTIEHLEYEAYPEMALQEMERIADEAGGCWPGVRVAMAHRVGRLVVGDLAVVIVAASAH